VAIPAEQVLSRSRAGARLVGVATRRSGDHREYKVASSADAIVRLHDTILSHWTGCRLSSTSAAAGEAHGIDDVPIVALTLGRATLTAAPSSWSASPTPSRRS
jgi:hypothetical protein